MTLPLNAEFRARGAICGIILGAAIGLPIAAWWNGRSGFVLQGASGLVTLLGVVVPVVTVTILRALWRAIVSAIFRR